MASFSRYAFNSSRKNDEGKSYKKTNRINSRIRFAVQDGVIDVKAHVLEEGERLDSLAQAYLGSSEYWWVIAACSGIGWNLQVPPGTLLQIPNSISDVVRYLS